MGKRTCFLLIVCCIFAVQMPGLCADNPSLEQLAARHLESIGGADALSQIKSVAFTGTSDAEFIQGWFGTSQGTSILVSEGSKMALIMEFSAVDYRREYFACDGKAVTVGDVRFGVRAPLADFLYRYDKIIKNGLLGGVYSRAWPLFNVGRNRAKMKVRKTRVEDAELYELEYRPKDYHNDMKICLYFDPETWRHVRTDYYLSNYQGYDKRATLTEKFENFRKIGNLTLPHSYTLYLERIASANNYLSWNYSAGRPISDSDYSTWSYRNFIGKWKIEVSEWMFNRPDIDPKIFKVDD